MGYERDEGSGEEMELILGRVQLETHDKEKNKIVLTCG